MYKYKSFYMQTSEKAYPKVGPFTGSLGVDALAVWVPLIYFSQTAITFTKKVKVLWVSATTNFHSKSLAKYPTTLSQNVNILVKTKNAPKALKRKINLNFFVTWAFPNWGRGSAHLGIFPT